MTAGLPGTGIGGLFYFCLVLLMPLRELWWLAQGRSSGARWKTIAFYWTLLACIFAVVWGEGYLLTLGLDYAKHTHTAIGHWLAHVDVIRWPMLKFEGELATVISFGTLLAVCMIATLAHMTCRAVPLQVAERPTSDLN